MAALGACVCVWMGVGRGVPGALPGQAWVPAGPREDRWQDLAKWIWRKESSREGPLGRGGQ